PSWTGPRASISNPSCRRFCEGSSCARGPDDCCCELASGNKQIAANASADKVETNRIAHLTMFRDGLREQRSAKDMPTPAMEVVEADDRERLPRHRQSGTIRKFTIGTSSMEPADTIRGRGAGSNPASRFELIRYDRDPDCDPDDGPNPATQF